MMHDPGMVVGAGCGICIPAARTDVLGGDNGERLL
jgi:hypothetical protein